jgi:hypothetical protein
MASIPGVPNLLRNAPKAIGITLLGNAASALWNYLFPGPTWGVFNIGTSDISIRVSSVVEVDISSESHASDYPIQTGSFTTYNKVKTPDIVSIRMTKDGDDASRAFFLDWLNQNISETSLYDILTPEWRYPGMTLVGYRMSRSSRSGAAMIVADCLFQQVRQLLPKYSITNIESPENQPATPTNRVNTVPGEPSSAGGEVEWQ